MLSTPKPSKAYNKHTMSATAFVCKSLKQDYAHVMRDAHDLGVNVYSPDGMLYSSYYSCGYGSCTMLYKPFNPDCGIIYVHNNYNTIGDVALAAHVVLNHELKLCAWGNGHMIGYTDENGFHEFFKHALPQHSRRRTSVLQRTYAGKTLLQQVKSVLKELFTGYKVIHYSQQFHENMRKRSLKKASALGNILPEDMIHEVAAAHAPSWVFRPQLSQLENVHAYDMNTMHKDFVWNFIKSKEHEHTTFYTVWHVAEVPRGSWKWFNTIVRTPNVAMLLPTLDLIEHEVEGQYVLWEVNYTPRRPSI